MRQGLHFLVAGVVVYAVVAACSAAVEATAPDPAASGSGGAALTMMDPVPAAAAETPKSGSRLKARFYVGDDGSRQALNGMWDSERSEVCVFQTASDGKERCMPVGTTELAEPAAYVAGTESHE